MRIIYSLFILIIITFLSDVLFAQQETYEVKNYMSDFDRPIESYDFYTYRIASNSLDTIVAVRKPNKFWFGVLGGANFDFSYGDLYTYDANKEKPVRNLISYNDAGGYGYSLGFVAEFIPVGKRLGAGLKIIALDKYIVNSLSNKMGFYNEEYDLKSSLTYFTISPYVRYTVPKLGGLYVSAGPDVAINIGSKFEQTSLFTYNSPIEHIYNIDDMKANTRFGFNLGVGYDFFIADFFSGNNRVRITPFIDFMAGTSIITANNSNWNDIVIKTGVQIKLSPDKVMYDTLKYKHVEQEPVYVASIQTEAGIEYPGFVNLGTAPSVKLAVVDIPTIQATEIAVNNNATETNETIDVATKLPEHSTEQAITTTPIASKKNIKRGETNAISGYSSSSATQLTEKMKSELDEYVKFLKDNPNAIVRLTGHSDNRGTLAENNKRASDRANVVAAYFRNQGIPQSRIYVNNLGARYPVKTNDTEAGKMVNRRVEILIQ